MTNNYNQPNSFGQEGVDHINISAHSNTHLGKLLDPSYFRTVEYPHIGKFGSVLNLWYWLRSEPCNDALRRPCASKLRAIALSCNLTAYVPNFRAIIAYATYQKLIRYPNAINEIKNLAPEVSFVSYYNPHNSQLRVASNYARVIVEVAQFLREAIAAGQEPNFDKLLPQDADTQLTYLAPFMKERFPEIYQRLLEPA